MAASSGFVHMVYFWLNEGAGDAEAKTLVAGARRNLSAIPGVLRIDVGYAAGTDREVVDNSYGVGLIVEFACPTDHDVYQDHPGHLKFIVECSHLWSRLRVYDTIVAR